MIQPISYSFPLLTLEPGTEQKSTVTLNGPFRPEKLFMGGQMGVIRGHFKIKRSRLPLLDRDDVFAYSLARKTPERRRVVVAFTHPKTGIRVERSYLPSNVVYLHTDPLSYIDLLQLKLGATSTMSSEIGVAATLFGAESFGIGFRMPTDDTSMEITLRNHGDVPIKVFAQVIGVDFSRRTAR